MVEDSVVRTEDRESQRDSIPIDVFADSKG